MGRGWTKAGLGSQIDKDTDGQDRDTYGQGHRWTWIETGTQTDSNRHRDAFRGNIDTDGQGRR
jgi:hypothetical protein